MTNILIVDDSPTIIKVLEFTLEDAGYNVDSANNAEEAIVRVEQKKYDIGIFDVNMPGKNGIELTGDVLSSPNGSNMKIVILTTETGEKLKAAGKEVGVNAWLVKPFEDDVLMSVVSKL